ncbi:putative RNA-binding Zn ribbon-like protein [Kribbella antiqua]|uniref:Putative RNA-binding Zn ribbon-like protein n=1 Tax=Kribbella antiqua TaxID=2512217 RepID=A0A4R2IY73_9ACTN|nr:CGNR zinc finger domain-containing protein [Kribbella antiqua]TCO49962.1 putative RNA-binding Zn ribbon-like protein [Kribbella antiqua]
MTEDRNEVFRIVGGHPALELVNTVSPRVAGGVDDELDYIPVPAELLAWTRRTGLLNDAEVAAVTAAWSSAPGTAEQALHATVEIREAVYAVLSRSGESPAALELLTLRWSAAAARSVLVPGGAVAELVVGTSPASMIPDRLVTAAVELLRTVDLRQLRACPIDEGGCGWLFLDKSRNGSRRWCSMEDCGTRAKIRKLSERRRSATTD